MGEPNMLQAGAAQAGVVGVPMPGPAVTGLMLEDRQLPRESAMH